MPFSFPASPTQGQQSTQNGRTYSWSGSAWELVAASGGSLSASVTIPASGDPQWGNTVLLLNGDGNLTDSSSYGRTVTAYGNAAATGAAKFGSNSLTFDGDGDYLKIDSFPSLGSADWTIEAWVRVSSLSTGMFLLGASVENGLMVQLSADGKLYLGRASISWDLGETHGMSTNTWHHIAICRLGNQLRGWRDGTPLGAGATSLSGSFGTSALWIGSFGFSLGGAAGQPSSYINGQVDDLRITANAARYGVSSSFTPPTATYATGTYTAPQVLPVVFT